MQDRHHSKMESASPQCLVVMYHYVRKRDPLASDGIMSLDPREFERQLDQLCRQLEPIDWPTFLGWSRAATRECGRSRGGSQDVSWTGMDSPGEW